jgi:Putative collagen-binding domain of a collagenase
MTNRNDRVTNNNWCLLNPDNSSHIVIYLPFGGSVDVDLRELPISGSSYAIKWYDPQVGGELKKGTLEAIQADVIGSLGIAPYNTDQDWAVLLVCEACLQPAVAASPSAIQSDGPVSLPPGSVALPPSALNVPPTSSPKLSVMPTNPSAKTSLPTQKKTQVDANDIGISTKPTDAPGSSAEALLGRLTLSSMFQFVHTVALFVGLL